MRWHEKAEDLPAVVPADLHGGEAQQAAAPPPGTSLNKQRIKEQFWTKRFLCVCFLI